MQAQLDQLCSWSQKWGLKLNAAKCKVLTLTLRRALVVATYKIDGVVLERVRVMRDLGVTLDEKLAFGEHVDYAVRKANRALGLLIRTLQTGKNGRHLKTAKQCDLLSAYYANVRSILECGSVVWGGATESHIQRMERIQEKFLVWLCALCSGSVLSCTWGVSIVPGSGSTF